MNSLTIEVQRLKALVASRGKTYIPDEKESEHKAAMNASMPPTRDEVIPALKEKYGENI